MNHITDYIKRNTHFLRLVNHKEIVVFSDRNSVMAEIVIQDFPIMVFFYMLKLYCLLSS